MSAVRAHVWISPAASAVLTRSGRRDAERSKQTDVCDGGFGHSKGIWVPPRDPDLTDRLTSITMITAVTSPRAPEAREVSHESS